ncbi:MAG: hypothetical protein QGF74_02960 [Candidatus Nanoarchaeia archaeon]|jgi:hypothetical protein|nr:hypothetical protein [Candidatus Nanoarchaeia archaeon]|tara:strand:- start:4624 stop:5097 length:474 start_codon:yes stop_codon:yes gene_type:complete
MKDNSNLEKRSLTGFKRVAGVLALALLTYGCGGMQQKQKHPLIEGTPNTLTCVDRYGQRQTIYDLRGRWRTKYSDGPTIQEVTISQNCTEFLGIKTKGGVHVVEGSQTIKGVLEKSGFKEVQVYDSDEGWRDKNGTISNNGKNIELWGQDTITTLDR